jgi:rubredoxin
MGKHVCPVCEDIYAVKASIDVRHGDRSNTVTSWGCPACGYIFVGVADLEGVLRWTVTPLSNDAPSATGRLDGSPTVVHKVDVQPALS